MHAPRQSRAGFPVGRIAASMLTAVALAVAVAGCGSSSGVNGSSAAAPSASTSATASATTSSGAIVNTWAASTVDPTKLPIGDANITTSGAGVGKLWICRAGNPGAGGADVDGPWLDTTAGTWNSVTKLAVEGKVSWPAAKYTEAVGNGKRVLTTNDLPVEGQTGTFPIATTDPSYQYDKNPGTITKTPTTVTLVEQGSVAASPTCLAEGPVGMLKNGVFAFGPFDGRGNDAVAHESQDLCNGHPAMTTYHYHNVPSCIRDATKGASTVVGWAYDGFPIVVERDASGALPTNADLDNCHGRTSLVAIDGEDLNVYHYSATLEFPYFIGCYKGTPASTN